MNTEQIIQLAQEAAKYADEHHEKHAGWLTAERFQFAALVAQAEREAYAKRRGTLLFNPYSGKPRHPSDIASDPHGILMVEPDALTRAAKKIEPTDWAAS